MDEVLYISDMLIDKAFDYIKHGLNILYIIPKQLK